MRLGRIRKVFASVAVVFAVVLVFALIFMRGLHSTHQTVVQAQRLKSLRLLDGALWCYADKQGSFPPAHTTNSAGRPRQSWRVLLLPYVDHESLYSQLDLNEPWDSPANRRLLEPMPEYYRSPLEAETHGTATNYFAVLGPHAPWGSSIERVRQWAADAPDEIILIELTGLKTPWMEPRDLTLEQVLDILRPESGRGVSGGRATDIMYLTVGGNLRTVDPKTDRESLRKLFLGGGK
jgi:hypothetical protein